MEQRNKRPRINRCDFDEVKVVNTLQELYPNLSRSQIWKVYTKQKLSISDTKIMLNFLTQSK